MEALFPTTVSIQNGFRVSVSLRFLRVSGRWLFAPALDFRLRLSTSSVISLLMDQKTDYAKSQEASHRRKIVLPCVIPWEYGSNKYASQKGSSAFGTIRNATTKINSSKELSESNDGVVPQITCLPLHKKVASQAGQNSFGNFREQVTKVTDKDSDQKIVINKIIDDKMTETILKKWDRPNNEATNSSIGKRRETVTESTGGRRFTKEELKNSRGVIPKLNDPRNTIAAQEPRAPCFQGFCPRQATTSVQGADDLSQLERNRYMAWLGGQLTLQSQSKTGGFGQPRDVAGMSYYEKLMKSRELDPKMIRKRLEEEQARREKEEKETSEKEEEETIVD